MLYKNNGGIDTLWNGVITTCLRTHKHLKGQKRRILIQSATDRCGKRNK